MPKNPDDYEVGYKKPPMHTRFAPGVSGRKGRKKPPETRAQMIARLRDQKVMLNGRQVTKFELAVEVVINQTIKSGKVRDLAVLMELLDRYGALPIAEEWADAQARSEEVFQKIMKIADIHLDIDPEDVALLEQHARTEADLVMGCSHCSPMLREQWADSARKALSKRYGMTGLHKQVDEATAARGRPPK